VIPMRPRWTVLCLALVVWCPTVGLEIVRVAAQAPEESQGWHIPEGAAGERSPAPLTPATLGRGQSLYRSKCQRCHGADGTGNGPDGDPAHRPGDLTDARRASRNPDGVMFYKIWNGRTEPKMPAMKTDASESDVWAVIHYVKTLRKGTTREQ
jgi:mono/diheme cytochrome c family protein